MPSKYDNLQINEDIIHNQPITIDSNPIFDGRACYKTIMTNLNKKS